MSNEYKKTPPPAEIEEIAFVSIKDINDRTGDNDSLKSFTLPPDILTSINSFEITDSQNTIFNPKILKDYDEFIKQITGQPQLYTSDITRRTINNSRGFVEIHREFKGALYHERRIDYQSDNPGDTTYHKETFEGMYEYLVLFYTNITNDNDTLTLPDNNYKTVSLLFFDITDAKPKIVTLPGKISGEQVGYIIKDCMFLHFTPSIFTPTNNKLPIKRTIIRSYLASTQDASWTTMCPNLYKYWPDYTTAQRQGIRFGGKYKSRRRISKKYKSQRRNSKKYKTSKNKRKLKKSFS